MNTGPAGLVSGVTDPVLAVGSMAEVLLARAAQTPDAIAYHFLTDGREEGPRLTYSDLDREARAIAVALQDVAGPGDRALLLYAPGLSFISAFFGCQYAGVVPVPAYPPRPDRLVQGWEALGNVAADCGPAVVLTDRVVGSFLPGRGGPVPALDAVPRIVTDDLDPASARRWRAPRFDPEALALLQYTSGSTALPKGVMVAHRNLMHNQRVILTAKEHYRHVGVGVNWLPTYHDMGLIGGILQTAYRGATLVLMSPTAFLLDPMNWMRAVSRYRADTSGGPNFAYDLCVQRSTPEERAALDLRNWSVAAIGSEPVNPATMRGFTAAFEPAGFRPEAFYPCYGLAEATVFVTGGLRTAPPVVRHLDAAALERGVAVLASEGPAARTVVGCGRAWLDQEVRVVDPRSRTTLADGCVGEIWVRGPSVARGYWNRPSETDEVFRARLADGGGPYLRTGDLGFVQVGELFITGRIKDVIVIRGRNHYPHDIEATVQSVHPALRPGCGAAFEVVREGQPRLVVVQEIDRRGRGLDIAKLTGDVRQAVAERHELQMYELVLLEYGSIPKTSSGKVRRADCRVGYENGGLRTWKARPA
jgi:acyl-CoA synthetase (AMP-forming)/AMP-acid ligase II